MIARIQYRKDFGRVIGYAMKKTKNPELLASTLTNRNTHGMIDEMKHIATRSSRCKQPVAHYVLSVREGERLSDAQWAEASQRVAGQLKMQQYICMRHSDTDCDHIHLIANRVHANGKAWSTSNDRMRMRTLCKEIEGDFGLTTTATRSRRSRIGKDEIEKAERLYKEGKQPNAVPARMLLAEEAKATLALSRSRVEFEERLNDKGIQVQWRHDKKGKPVGISFGRREVSISGRNAGISCREVILHFEGGKHESGRRITGAGPSSRLGATIGTGNSSTIEAGAFRADRGDGGTDLTNSGANGSSAHYSGSDSGTAAAALTESAKVGGQLMVTALDRMIREIDDDREPKAKPSLTLKRILQAPRKKQRRPRR